MEVNKSIGGIQVDLVINTNENDKIIVECKAYSKLVGLRTVDQFASSVYFMRESNPKLKAWLITSSGFTSNAQKALRNHQIDGYTINDLRRRFDVSLEDVENRFINWEEKSKTNVEGKKQIFVIMPFSEDMLDVFILGIRWAADELGVVVKRGDELEHNGEIIQEVRNAIKAYDLIIADTTGSNPNVCYEVGFAHAIDKPTILICKKGEDLPFDLQGTNHIFYENIIGLREPLKQKIALELKI